MKTQTTGILLCALLFTTFGHEILNRQKVAHEAKHANLQHARSHSLLSRRDKDNDRCHVVCEPNNGNQTESSNVTVIVHGDLFVTLNVTAKVAFAISVNTSIVAIFNGTSGSYILIDLKESKGVFVSSGGWDGKDFEKYSATLNFTALWKSGTEFTESNASEEVKLQIQWALVVLSSGAYHVTTKKAFKLLVDISLSIQSSLKVVIKVLRVQTFSSKTSLKSIIESLRGLAYAIQHFKGGIELIEEHNVTLSVEFILTAKSSISVLIYIAKEVYSADMEHMIGGSLNSSLTLLEYLSRSSGDSSSGVNGLILLLARIVAVINDPSVKNIDVLIDCLIEFYSANSSPTLEKDFKAEIRKLLKLLKSIRTDNRFKYIIELLENILHDRWVEKDVNISAIIKLLVKSDANRTRAGLILSVLFIVRVVRFKLFIARFIWKLILLVFQGGIRTVANLLGQGAIAGEYLASNGLKIIIQYFVKNIQIFITNLLHPARLIRNIPVIGDIFEVVIKESVKVCNGHGSEKITIEAIIRYDNFGAILFKYFISIARGGEHGGSVTVETTENSSESSGRTEIVSEESTIIESSSQVVSEVVTQIFSEEITGGTTKGSDERHSGEHHSGGKSDSNESHHSKEESHEHDDKAHNKHHAEHKHIRGKHYSHHEKEHKQHV